MMDTLDRESHLRFEMDQAAQQGRADDWHFAAGVLADWLEDTDRTPEAVSLRDMIAAQVQSQAVQRPSKWPCVDDLAHIDTHQADVLRGCLVRPLCILTGGPGTGKTYCVASILSAISDPLGVAVCAPTGKAAVRMNQGLRNLGIRYPLARTIHQTLAVGRNGHDGGDWGFLFNATNRLPYRWVIVDEASMLDTYLASSLLSACAPGTHVLLVGDPDQLPPVGHGSPLRDLIAAGVPCGQLTEIRRNAGRIVEACKAIREEQDWESATFGQDWCNLQHVEASTPRQQMEALVHTVLTRLRTNGEYDLTRDVQVICAVNQRSPMARDTLNRVLQSAVNTVPGELPNLAPLSASASRDRGKNGGKPARPVYRVGDKAICLKNGWYNGYGAQQIYVANGEQGIVYETSDRMSLVRFGSRGERDVMVPVAGEIADSFGLGYAITAHKSQGSEWPVVIVMVDDSPAARNIATKPWWYTTISRASKLCVTIGRGRVMREQAKRVTAEQRRTFLREAIHECVSHNRRGQTTSAEQYCGQAGTGQNQES